MIRITSCGQEMPVYESRVEIDPRIRDYWGLPVARISGRPHPNDRLLGAYLAEKAETWLKEAGAIRTWRTGGAKRGASGGVHQPGTCRMGNDAKTSVVNRYCQSHDIDNLFIVDASVHVTNGGFNPGLTVFAIGFWAADYIKRQWAGGAFRGGRG